MTTTSSPDPRRSGNRTRTIDNLNKISYTIDMTMHLVGPYLTTTGKKKGKQRFRTAANAAQARELRSDWQALLDRHGVAQSAPQRRRKTDFEPMKRPPVQYRGSDQPRIPSRVIVLVESERGRINNLVRLQVKRLRGNNAYSI